MVGEGAVAGVGPREVLGLLADGRREDALLELDPSRADGATPQMERFAPLLRHFLDPSAAPGPAPGRRPLPASGGPMSGGDSPDPELDAAIETLEHMVAASRALRSGRVDELVAGALAASAAAPSAFPWLALGVGSVLQAAYRFTARADLRIEALAVCGRVADRLELPRLAVPARALMGNIHMLRGSLHRTLEHCEAALALAASTGAEGEPSAAMAHQFRGYVLLEWGRPAEAREALERAWALAGEPGRGVRSGVARTLAELHAAAGDPDAVDRWLERLVEVMAEPLTLRNREWLAAVRVRLSLGTGDLREVERWLGAYDYRTATLESMTAPELLSRLHELDRVLAFREATEGWEDILRIAPRVTTATRDERRWFAVRAATAEAMALEATGRPGDADRCLDDALALGEEGGFVRAFTEGSVLRSTLLERAAVERGSREAKRILEATRPSLRRERTPLTPTQVAVLRRVAAGGSNKAVAREMGVSVSTVKTHLRHVFARLEVSSRTQAVARAREEGLIG